MSRRGSRICIGIFSVLLFVGGVSGQTTRISFTGLDEAALRSETIQRLRRFAQTFKGQPAAAEAQRLADEDSKTTNPHAWIGGTLEWVDRSLKACPPSAQENREIRKAIQMILDYPLHVPRSHLPVSSDYGPEWAEATGRHFQRVVAPAIEQIGSTRTDRGLDIWKIYNMGFVVRSKNHCVGFDIIPGMVKEPYALSNEQMKVLTDRMEILFISHAHMDHLDYRFVRRMLDAGKKVVLPAAVARDLNHGSVIRLYDDYQKPHEISGMNVYCWPGWQSRPVAMGVYAVNMDGHWVAHNGDNLRREIYAEIPKRCAVDVLLGNCWSGFGVLAEATRPKLMITGHENELGHKTGGRRGFGETYHNLDLMTVKVETRIIDWGECLHWEP